MHCPLRTKVTEIQCLLCPLEEVGSVKQSKLEKLQLLGEEEEKNTASLETTGWGGEMHSGKAAVRDPWWWQGRASLWSSVLLCFSLGAVWVHPSVFREHPCCSGGFVLKEHPALLPGSHWQSQHSLPGVQFPACRLVRARAKGCS